MKFLCLGSGSCGNCYYLESGGTAIIIDLGIGIRAFKRHARDYGLRMPDIKAILVTHDHTDHTSGLRVLLNKVDVPVYANAMTAEAVACQEHVDANAFVCFENGQSFDVGPFAVSPFSVPHDATDPVGYLVRGERVYFHGTDIGTPLDSIGLKLAEATIATLESNHDPVMLRTSGRPPYLIQRIAGPRGHLSNDQACDLVRRFASPRLKKLFLAHLSHQCNAEAIAVRLMRETLAEIGRTDIELEVAG